MDIARTAEDKDNLPETKVWKFSDILAIPEVKQRWLKVKKYFFLRESTYDMTNRCNIRCNGCYYFEGEKQFAKENIDVQAWRQHMEKEKERGITYVVLAGAEPSLVPELCQACYDVLPLGCIATNGFKKIPESVGYKLHISVWGNDETSRRVRKAKDLLLKQIENYKSDPRAVFVYTFTKFNIDEADSVIQVLEENGCKATFNMFSEPVGYTGDLKHDAASLARTREKMLSLIEKYPETVLFSPYNAVTHTHTKGLHDLFECPYPRRNPSGDLGLGRTFRQYRTDLTWDRDAACCVPDTDCDDCRHYAAGSAVVTSKLYRHAENPDTFKAWLDYVETYLAVWVTGYDKGANLTKSPTPPPGHNVF